MAPATSKTATPKATKSDAGVKKAPPPRKAGKKGNARNAMIKMQAYCKFGDINALMSRYWTRCHVALVDVGLQLTVPVKENRSKYKDLDFKEQQKELGKDVSLKSSVALAVATTCVRTLSTITSLTFCSGRPHQRTRRMRRRVFFRVHQRYLTFVCHHEDLYSYFKVEIWVTPVTPVHRFHSHKSLLPFSSSWSAPLMRICVISGVLQGRWRLVSRFTAIWMKFEITFRACNTCIVPAAS
jgi:hypothetical protein